MYKCDCKMGSRTRQTGRGIDRACPSCGKKFNAPQEESKRVDEAPKPTLPKAWQRGRLGV